MKAISAPDLVRTVFFFSHVILILLILAETHFYCTCRYAECVSRAVNLLSLGIFILKSLFKMQIRDQAYRIRNFRAHANCRNLRWLL